MTNDKGKARQRSERQWFAEAERCYVEEHQGCPCCGSRHCVFRARWGCRTEYHCNECDFSAAYDDAEETYAAINGQPGTAVTVMLEGVWDMA